MNIATAVKRLQSFVLAGALVAAAATVASAAIPAANGTINACYDKQTGQTRLVDPADNLPKGCTQKESPVSWNAQGPAGPAGPAGVSGLEKVYAKSATNSNGDKTTFVMCPPGKWAIGGGGGVYGAEVAGGQVIIDGVGLVQDHPFSDAGWGARASEFVPTSLDWHVSVWVLCADG